MNKKEYMKPAMQEVKIQHRAQILTISKDNYGMNKRIVTSGDDDYEEVEAGW